MLDKKLGESLPNLGPLRPTIHGIDGLEELGAAGVLMSLQFDECWQQIAVAPECLIRLSTKARCWCSRWRVRSLTNLSPPNNDLGPIPDVYGLLPCSHDGHRLSNPRDRICR